MSGTGNGNGSQHPILPPFGTSANPNSVAPYKTPLEENGPVSHGARSQSAQNRDPADPMRAYRACLHCRNRKSKCDLEPNNGRPPCRRCQRENRECVLGESHRGGRRVRKKPKLDEEADAASEGPVSVTASSRRGSPKSQPQTSPRFGMDANQSQQPSEPFHTRYDNRQTWQPTAAAGDGPSRYTEYPPILSPTINQSYRSRMESTVSIIGKPSHAGIATADLQNPSDALEILAQVADRADDSNSPRSDDPAGPSPKRVKQRPEVTFQPVETSWHYRPLQERLINQEQIYSLFNSFEQFYHPFFPIVPRDTFNPQRLQWVSRYEPHLFSAILTVASKDDEALHQVCYDHMQQLISNIASGSDANVEAVEALLLLSQWVSHKPQVAVTVGRGEEDRVAWMYIGTALRLAYFLEIDRTSFSSDTQEDPVKYNRKRLVWAACYICDRQVSVRVGKGFWARGPGPLSGLKADNFPTLQRVTDHDEDFATIFQANLELTQIFSNVLDILYSSKGNAWKDMLEGRYAKYLDDFRYSIRTWRDNWGSLNCHPFIKVSLMITYDYLRLYVNAFAYQATISRALTDQRDSQHSNGSIPLINSSAPDARFIYEAVSAAQSLLTRFNDSVSPETLRHMPSSYYLFVIYSAVFLYKARSTTSLQKDEREEVHKTIRQTIERLQASSIGGNQIGNRYARLLELLWRKSPKRNGNKALHRMSVDNRMLAQQQQQALSQAQGQNLAGISNGNRNQNLGPGQNVSSDLNPNQIPGPDTNNQQQNFDPNLDPNIYYKTNFPDPFANNMHRNQGQYPAPVPVPHFSWLDLSATSQYAQQNGPSSSGSGEAYEGIGELGSPWDAGGGGYEGSGSMDGVAQGFMDPGFLDGGVGVAGGGDLIF
ncbi:uncharacterized protein RCO7_04039 [Rhynchosporium graminicola]|uniref:Zn(2)-C6 fungal-type domain-containing protein n=1 Tax=Rhynchosporium graminicola TaxID=2792576 RepID=A0A1E1LHF0_9HELO|nr:uncharacterized protein RCO7_04039 [Rhynchosporium commune]